MTGYAPLVSTSSIPWPSSTSRSTTFSFPFVGCLYFFCVGVVVCFLGEAQTYQLFLLFLCCRLFFLCHGLFQPWRPQHCGYCTRDFKTEYFRSRGIGYSGYPTQSLCRIGGSHLIYKKLMSFKRNVCVGEELFPKCSGHKRQTTSFSKKSKCAKCSLLDQHT